MNASENFRVTHVVSPTHRLRNDGRTSVKTRRRVGGLRTLQLWSIALMLALLTGANGRPYWWNSAFPAIAISLSLLATRPPRQIRAALLSRRNLPVFACMLLLLVWTSLAALVHLEFDTVKDTILRAGVPLLIYVSLAGIPVRRRDLSLLATAVIVGALFPLTRGVLAFYAEWGVPDLRTLLWARFDRVAMEAYSDVTFGSLGHMGMYVVMITPFVLTVLLVRRELKVRLWLVLALLFVLAANLMISGSRAALALTLGSSFLLVLALGGARGRWLVLVAVTSIGLANPFRSPRVNEIMIDRFLPTVGATGYDSSAEERIESIVVGWETFVEHPVFGVGPGKSPEYNRHFIPHQSWVMVLSEIGIVGGLLFAAFNGIVLQQAISLARRARLKADAGLRLVWLVGPAMWMLFGILAGLSFNMNLALLWTGISAGMLGVSTFGLIDESGGGRPRRARQGA